VFAVDKAALNGKRASSGVVKVSRRFVLRHPQDTEMFAEEVRAYPTSRMEYDGWATLSDEYFDYENNALARKNMWLMSRTGSVGLFQINASDALAWKVPKDDNTSSWRLLTPSKTRTAGVNSHIELVDDTVTKLSFMTGNDELQAAAVGDQLKKFAGFETKRTQFSTRKADRPIRLYVDTTDFGFKVLEIETEAEDSSESITLASSTLEETRRFLGVSAVPVRSTIEEYLYRFRRPQYDALVQSGAVESLVLC